MSALRLSHNYNQFLYYVPLMSSHDIQYAQMPFSRRRQGGLLNIREGNPPVVNYFEYEIDARIVGTGMARTLIQAAVEVLERPFSEVPDVSRVLYCIVRGCIRTSDT